MPTLQETHWAVISDNNDPDHRGRLKLKCQSLIGADYELPDWVEPSGNLMASNGGLGALFLPENGSTVELVADVHDTEFDDMPGERFLQNPNFKWRPAAATDKAGPMPLPDPLLADYPNTRGWVTKAGHQLLFNDKTGEIIVKGAKGGVITLKADGSIVLSSPTLIGDGATELMILGNAFMTLYNAHIHPTGVGPSGPPTAPMTTAQLSAAGNKVK
jgi:hypothetical protein